VKRHLPLELPVGTAVVMAQEKTSTAETSFQNTAVCFSSNKPTRTKCGRGWQEVEFKPVRFQSKNIGKGGILMKTVKRDY
jgi:hypothetical protein